MERDDRIAFGLILAVLCAVSLGSMWVIKVVGAAVFGWFASTDAGVGFRDALPVALGVAVVLVVLFALVAGDGLLGELPTVLVGFLALSAFFTFAIAWMF